MKEKIKLVIYFVLFSGLIIAAMFGYKVLSSIDNKGINYSNESYEKKTKLPEFHIYTETGEKVSIKEFIGKPIIINIWTSWCPYCSIEMPYFNEVYLNEKDNVHFVMLNATGDRDTKEKAKEFVEENKCSFNIYYDFNLKSLESLGIYSYPSTVFIDKDGYIDSIKIGIVTKDELLNKIKRLK